MSKRCFDWLGSTAGLLVLLPLLLTIAVLVRLFLGSPVFFVQERPGLHGRPFRIIKFRTMRSECDGHGNPLPDAHRLTAFGRWLRSTSLDELPELWNVLKGDMSLVGPRPLLMSYLGRYTERQARRHEVRPGLTGWAQVNGRNALSWNERFELDVWYVDNQSLLLDMKIIFMTLSRVLLRQGVSSEGHVTMPEFLGEQEEKEGRHGHAD
jgi:lipopolysaccharide/colanic/teichoic acid biosynthesis glycosyltransferase